ncbi:NAD(P)H-dependent oxidoreductase [Streptomyces sp. NPDC012510]|uniref:NADPH-dependent FMN reductase n=1 Tax=Streptomyces sp. NPDC012510 TaxID=3364838 RepID=UPI0036E37127
MSENSVRVAVIVGSVREGRFAPVVLNWFVDRAAEHGGFDVDVVDLADADLPMVLPAFGSEPSPETAAAVGAVTPRLAAADAFVVITPEYNHSYPASLKNLIDWHDEEFHAKPVAFVSYGGLSGGLRAVEHLRPVFAELQAVTIRNTISFHNAGAQFGQDGRPKDSEPADAAAKVQLDQLDWWARSLKEARDKRPYKV